MHNGWAATQFYYTVNVFGIPVIVGIPYIVGIEFIVYVLYTLYVFGLFNSWYFYGESEDSLCPTYSYFKYHYIINLRSSKWNIVYICYRSLLSLTLCLLWH